MSETDKSNDTSFGKILPAVWATEVTTYLHTIQHNPPSQSGKRPVKVTYKYFDGADTKKS